MEVVVRSACPATAATKEVVRGVPGGVRRELRDVLRRQQINDRACERTARGGPVLGGGTIGTNLKGSADALAEATKSSRPPGIDYSRSVFASPRFTRLFGVTMLVVGVVFVAGAVRSSDRPVAWLARPGPA